MSNYTKTTDFEAKDSLPSGDSGKIIRGSEFETEFDNIATAIATKADAASPTFTGTVTIDGLTVNGNTTLGNAATDTVTVTADIASNLIPSADDTYNLGASGAEWNDLYVDGVAYIDTIDGFATTGDITFTGASYNAVWDTSANRLQFGDNARATFGADNDLQIWHDGSNSNIKDNGTGDLYFIASNDIWMQGSNGETMLRAQEDGFVRLYYDNSIKLATTSTGVDVTGTVVADSATIGSDGAVYDLIIESNAPILQLSDTSASTTHSLISNNAELRVQADSLLSLRTDNKKRLDIDSGGDVSLFEDTGTSAKFFWDSSAESLTLGTGLGGTANHPLNVGGEIAVINNSGANPSDAGSFYWKESGSTWGTDMFGARARYDGSANILKFEFANLTSTGTNLELERDTGNVHIPTGNVGIGTTSPSALLELAANNNGSENNTLRITDTDTFVASGDTLGKLEFYATDGAAVKSFVKAEYANAQGDAELVLGTSSGASAATERMRIDASGNVGIGTNSPEGALSVSNNGAEGVEIDYTGGTMRIVSFDRTAVTDSSLEYRASEHVFKVSTSEKMRIDSDGNVLVGKTSSAFAVAGHELNADGLLVSTRDGNTVAVLNREGDNGSIIQFRQDNGTVGNIGSLSGNQLTIDSFGDRSGLRLEDNGVLPRKNSAMADGTVSLGSGTYRWKDLYLSGGVYLGGTAAANKLDDYEEGTFTPAFAATGLSVTYDIQSGNYTKIGNVVYFQIQFGTDAASGTSASEALTISGLPFSLSGVQSSGRVGLMYGLTSDKPNITWVAGVGSSTITLYEGDTTQSFVTLKSNILNTGANKNRMNIVGFYRTDA